MTRYQQKAVYAYSEKFYKGAELYKLINSVSSFPLSNFIENIETDEEIEIEGDIRLWRYKDKFYYMPEDEIIICNTKKELEIEISSRYRLIVKVDFIMDIDKLAIIEYYDLLTLINEKVDKYERHINIINRKSIFGISREEKEFDKKIDIEHMKIENVEAIIPINVIPVVEKENIWLNNKPIEIKIIPDEINYKENIKEKKIYNNTLATSIKLSPCEST